MSQTKPESIHELNADLFAPGADERASDAVRARKKAMDYLARREHGREELTAKLIGAGFEPETARDVVARLADEGLQDDRRFVESFVQSRVGQGKGPVRIRSELGQRGHADGIIDEALEGSGTDWFALAREVRLKKFGAALPGDFREKARQMRFLQYRGFEQAHVQAAVSAEHES